MVFRNGTHAAIGLIGFLILLLAGSSRVAAQGRQPTREIIDTSRYSHIVVPQFRGFSLRHDATEIRIDAVHAEVEIVDQAASTTLDIRVTNPGRNRAEAVLLLPVPEGAVVSAFDFEGSASEPTAEILLRDEARRMYESIVAQIRDPALLEFAGYNLVRSSAFPVEPGKSQRIRLTYESILETDTGRVDYLLPRSESLAAEVPWTIDVDLRATHPISTVYSPSHQLSIERTNARSIHLSLRKQANAQPGPFRLSYLVERDDVTASLFAYPDPKVGGGYFLMLAGLPVTLPDDRSALKREVTMVLDRSGSMAGEKMQQTIDAVRQVIAGLDDDEWFNVIDYATTVERFAARPVRRGDVSMKDVEAYLARLRPRGGTNIHDALVAALRQPPTNGTIPIVLFLTDGLPTIGQTNERAIRESIESGNTYERRIFTIGVGTDVNAPLLDRVAEVSRAQSEYILPGEHVEVKVAEVFQRLYGPVFADLSVEIRDRSGRVDPSLVREVMPVIIPDLYQGDQLLLVGQYVSEQPIEFVVSGQYLGTSRRFSFDFTFDSASVDNAFVARLWADRRIGYLIDEVRRAGEGLDPSSAATNVWSLPGMDEVLDEILRLSTEFGILSEYTSFLATDGTDLGDWENLLRACASNLDGRALKTRWGAGAVNQSINNIQQKGRQTLNYHNTFVDANLDTVQIANVQQICDRAFYKQGARWIDSNLVAQNEVETPDEVIEFGSDRHIQLLHRLITEGRAGLMSLSGEILMEVDGRRILVRNDASQQ